MTKRIVGRLSKPALGKAAGGGKEPFVAFEFGKAKKWHAGLAFAQEFPRAAQFKFAPGDFEAVAAFARRTRGT